MRSQEEAFGLEGPFMPRCIQACEGFRGGPCTSKLCRSATLPSY